MTSHHDDPQWSEQHRSAILETAPDVPPFSAAEQDALWRHVQDHAPTRPRRTHRWRATATAIITAGAVGFAGAAVAGIFSAHTGRGPTDAEDLELGGPGERLNPAAPDFAKVLDSITGDIAFPSAKSRDRALSWEVDDLSDEDTRVSTGALRLWVAGHSLCSWSNTWAVARRAGDTATEQRAAEVILGARTWPAIAETDSDLGEEAAWIPVLEQAVRAGDTAAASTSLQGQACMPGLAPELGLGEQ